MRTVRTVAELRTFLERKRVGPCAIEEAVAELDATCHTPVGVSKQSERVKLSVTAKDRRGSGLPGILVMKDIARDTVPKVYSVDETGTYDNFTLNAALSAVNVDGLGGATMYQGVAPTEAKRLYNTSRNVEKQRERSKTPPWPPRH